MTLRELINKITDNALEKNCLDSAPQLDYNIAVGIEDEGTWTGDIEEAYYNVGTRRINIKICRETLEKMLEK